MQRFGEYVRGRRRTSSAKSSGVSESQSAELWNITPFVDHDKLAYLPWGLVLAFATEGVPATAH
jgi:hypothetical protein